MILDPQQLIRRHLTDTFVILSKKNSRFSLRAYAKRLGLSNSALSEMMRGKRKISGAKALELAAALKIPPKDMQILKNAFDPKRRIESLRGTDVPLTEVLLDPTNFHLMGDWRYFAVMALVRGSRGLLSSAVMGDMLDLKEPDVKDIVNELLRTGLVKRKAGGEFEVTPVVFRTAPETTAAMLRQRRLDSLAGAERALREEWPGERSFFATIGADRAKVEAATELIEDFLKRIAVFLRDPKSTDVFELSINLFPRTRELKSRVIENRDP